MSEAATDAAWEFCHRMETELQLSGEPMQVFPSEEALEAFEKWRKEAALSEKEVTDGA